MLDVPAARTPATTAKTLSLVRIAFSAKDAEERRSSPSRSERCTIESRSARGGDPVSPAFYWAAAARVWVAAAAGRWALRKVRMWRTANGILSGVSFHG